jgi:endonuclease YncB( thermonuclease family)
MICSITFLMWIINIFIIVLMFRRYNKMDGLDELVDYDNIKEPAYTFKVAKVISVYDGDTFTIVCRYYDTFCKFHVRLYGVNCEELKGGTPKQKEQAKLAKEFVSDLILNKVVDIDVLTNTLDENGRVVKEKYGRLLAKVKVGDVDLAEELVRKGLAKRYIMN